MKKKFMLFFAMFMFSLMILPSVIAPAPAACPAAGDYWDSDSCTWTVRTSQLASCSLTTRIRCFSHLTTCTSTSPYCGTSTTTCSGSLRGIPICTSTTLYPWTCSWTAGTPTLYYLDSDGDTVGNPSTQKNFCSVAEANKNGYYATSNGDCNDADPTIYKGAPELCDNKDNNCNGVIDEGFTGIFYYDADGEGYGNPAITHSCQLPGYRSQGGDCNDGNSNICPVCTEVCNNVDDNCNGQIDEGLPRYYRDADGDGYGNPAISTCSPQPSGYINNNQDCDDSRSATYPGAPETCNNIDDNCNGVIDSFNAPFNCNQVGACAGANKTCTAGVVVGECNILPQTETCNNSDDNCDGITDNVADPDTCERACTTIVSPPGTWNNAWLEGTKCCGDDNGPPVYEGRPYEVNETLCYDGHDNDCDGEPDMEDTDCDPTPPELGSIISNPTQPIAYQPTSLIASASDANIKTVGIASVGSLNANISNECVGNTCILINPSGYKVGTYYFYAWASDLAGNYQLGDLQSFSIRGNTALSCEANTLGEGINCSAGEYCSPPGVFVNSKDGGNTAVGTEGYNELTAFFGKAKCCTSGKCTSEYVMPKCESYPVNGIQYDPTIASCSGIEIQAEVESLELKCCSGTPVVNFEGGTNFTVYWSRQNSGYYKLKEAAEGDNLFCIASAKAGNGNIEFKIMKGDNIESTSTQIELSKGYASVQKIADETGTYVCTATMGGQTASAEVKVTEAGKDPTKLPVFGAMQLIIASLLIGLYYWKKTLGKVIFSGAPKTWRFLSE